MTSGELTVEQREPLLLLCHRIPYPPDKGDKIRSYHLLKYLSERYAVCLATFVDDDNDWQHLEMVKTFCHRSFILPRSGLPELGPLLAALACGRPLTLPLYYRSELASWVTGIVAELGIQRALVYSSAMGQYLDTPALLELQTVVDFVDVDSDKWRQYARQKMWPLSWLYRREANRLLAYEKALHARCVASLFVSSAEAAMFSSLQPPSPERIGYFNNGVDSEYFCPDDELIDPFPPGSRALVFTGAMDYWPNIDAVTWFAREVFPRLHSAQPELVFYIVGSQPGRKVKRLADLPGVQVTGRVADVRPYLEHCLAAVAPLRVARGVQNKVLEAMAMSRPVLVTTQGLEGIAAVDGREVLVTDCITTMEQRVLQLLGGQWRDLGSEARRFVLKQFNWHQTLPVVDQLLQQGGTMTDPLSEQLVHD